MQATHREIICSWQLRSFVCLRPSLLLLLRRLSFVKSRFESAQKAVVKCNYKITIVYLYPPTPSHTHLRPLSIAIHSCSSILDFNKFFIALPVKCFSSLEHMSHSLALQKHRQHRKFIVMKFSHCRRMYAFNRTTTSESSVRSTDNNR